METLKEIFLDHHTSTKICTSSYEAFQRVSKKHRSSIYAPHHKGQSTLKSANEDISRSKRYFHGTKEDRFYCSSSGAQANLQVILSNFFHYMYETGKNHILTTTTEMASIFLPIQQLQKENCRLDLIDMKEDGTVNLEQFEKKLGPKTAFFSIGWASGLTGVIQPMEKIEKICFEKNVLLHVDVTYVMGKMEIDFEKHHFSFLTFDGEVLHAGKSFGGILVKPETSFEPFQMFHSDIASLSAFTEACRQAELYQDQMNLEVARLRDCFEEKIIQAIPGAEVLFTESPRLPNTSVIFFPHVHQESLLYCLNVQNVFASFGGNKEQHLCNVLMQMGFSSEVSQSTLSFSLSRYTTEEEILQAVDRIQKSYAHLRELSKEIF